MTASTYHVISKDVENVLFLLLAVILPEFHEKPIWNKDEVTEKDTQDNFCEEHQFFDCTPAFLLRYLLLSLSTPSPFSYDELAEWLL